MCFQMIGSQSLLVGSRQGPRALATAIWGCEEARPVDPAGQPQANCE